MTPPSQPLSESRASARKVMVEGLCREICKANGDDPDALSGWAAQVPMWVTHIPKVGDTLDAIAAAGLEIVRAHKWFKPEGISYDCCRDCGIVRRADDRNRPCIGPVRVGLRHHEPLKDEYMEGSEPLAPTPER